MRRIGLAVVLAFSLLHAPLAGEAQQVGRVYRVGILSTTVAPSPEEATKYPLFTSLAELGWVPGQNIGFEQRFAAGQADRLPRWQPT